MPSKLRGNIRVFCRCRPPTNKELQEHAEQSTVCVTFPEENIVDVYNDRGRNKTWEFDKVFGCDVDQSAIYEEVSPLVTSCLDGYQVCIFAYGQTGTGKTFTMTGPPSNRGVNTRALEELFRLSHARASEVRDDISVSILEIYNETIQDLLSTANANKKLEVRQSEHGNYVPDLTVVPVTMIEDVLSLMELGDANRSSACTNMNEHSSRSHLMISVQVTSTNVHTGAVTRGKLHLIDLAGSERLSKSGATGQALKEAQNINKSLSALGDVIAARASKQNHVPYRNSTLTYLLQDSLAADSKTLMFVCISPVIYNAEETFCSLNFASRVRTVELGKATVRHALSLDDGGGGGARASARSPSPFTSGSNGSLPLSVGSAQGQFSPVNQSRPRKR
ncbi:P-loop containing nucleoside triphosphate hydrolase protein [Tribonema minus]|uniref:Kinesin-like protein n=1 Tax=Tribonema minus TaxID=303371 RepID=A0A836CB76_9STRA|nr:P-loop containing nucleoside triphosphate hydrolase protein [Tribonema minus]